MLNPEQQKVLDDVIDGHNVFITGGAGAPFLWMKPQTTR